MPPKLTIPSASFQSSQHSPLDDSPISTNQDAHLDKYPKPTNRKRLYIGLAISAVSDVIILAILGICTIGAEKGWWTVTVRRGFFLNDTSIQLPYMKGDTVPASVAAVVGIVLPLFVIAIVDVLVFVKYRYIRKLEFKRTPLVLVQNFVNSVYAFLLHVLMVLLITIALKSFLGALRPDFYWRCDPDLTKIDPSVTYITPEVQDKICRGSIGGMTEGRKSTPSGHASISMAGMFFAVLYLENIHFSRYFTAAKPLVQFLLLLFALGVAASRVTDHKHSLLDVSLGMLLGIVVAVYFEFVVRRRHVTSIKKIFQFDSARGQ